MSIFIFKPLFLWYNLAGSTPKQSHHTAMVCQDKLRSLRKRFSSLEVEVMPKVWIPVAAPEGLAASLNTCRSATGVHISPKDVGETFTGKL